MNIKVLALLAALNIVSFDVKASEFIRDIAAFLCGNNEKDDSSSDTPARQERSDLYRPINFHLLHNKAKRRSALFELTLLCSQTKYLAKKDSIKAQYKAAYNSCVQDYEYHREKNMLKGRCLDYCNRLGIYTCYPAYSKNVGPYVEHIKEQEAALKLKTYFSLIPVNASIRAHVAQRIAKEKQLEKQEALNLDAKKIKDAEHTARILADVQKTEENRLRFVHHARHNKTVKKTKTI